MIFKVFAILSLFVAFGQICYAQHSTSPITQTQALREVKVKSFGGWKEAVSERGRFRILFPGTPRVSDDVVTMTGFKFTARPGANWFAYFSDLDITVTDHALLREKYRVGANASSHDGTKLLRQSDVYLNGKLGSELVLKGRGTMSYMRTFLVGSRIWVLSVDSFRNTNRGSTPPRDVQRFFDSFTFWE